MADWTIAVEGDADEAIARAILMHCKQSCLRALILGGKGRLDPKLRGYLDAASRSPWLILRDLDHDADCAPMLVAKHAMSGNRSALRIPVRSAEAWLLADTERAAR